MPSVIRYLDHRATAARSTGGPPIQFEACASEGKKGEEERERVGRICLGSSEAWRNELSPHCSITTNKRLIFIRCSIKRVLMLGRERDSENKEGGMSRDRRVSPSVREKNGSVAAAPGHFWKVGGFW
ncbi:hypothetical protein TNCV_1716931 [Trichonephila clavipes]|nr:hypothetical protein TNCV_1716931 [Trichonephila clavipes]